MGPWTKRILFILLAAALIAHLFAAPTTVAQTPASTNRPDISFADDVYPILRRACFECHGEAKQENYLRLDRREDALGLGVIEAGEPEKSELVRRIQLPRGHEGIMPAVGEPLPKRVPLSSSVGSQPGPLGQRTFSLANIGLMCRRNVHHFPRCKTRNGRAFRWTALCCESWNPLALPHRRSRHLKN